VADFFLLPANIGQISSLFYRKIYLTYQLWWSTLSIKKNIFIWFYCTSTQLLASDQRRC